MATMDSKKQSLKELEQLFEEALKTLQSGKKLEGRDGAITPIIKRLLEVTMEGEMDVHLSEARPNRRNGHGKKRLKTSLGEISVDTPRDRDSTFTPELIPKRKRTLGLSLENKIIQLYSSGMSYRDITHYIDEMYGMELSAAQLTTITDRVWPEIEEWRNRSMAAYLVLGMNKEGDKDYIARVALSANMDLDLHKKVFQDFVAQI